MDDSLDERVDAIERALTDGEAVEGLPEAGRVDARVEAVEESVADLDDRLSELEAAVQALRGFAGGIDAVDEAVERRANAAIARVERLERERRERERCADGNGIDERTRRDAGADRERRDLRARNGHGDESRDTRSEAAVVDDDTATVEDRRSEPDDATHGDRWNGRDEDRSADVVGQPPTTDRTAATLAQAAADTARSELETEQKRADPDAETTAPTLAERIRRLL
jgi:hypothetical protein